MNQVVLIPALNPDEKMICLIEELKKLGMDRIVVVDDGSGTLCQPLFSRARELGCIVLRHAENQGKGAALRTAFHAARGAYGEVSFITADADGQHLPEDIARVAEEMDRHPGSLVLGMREFSGADVPKKSMIGNRITEKVFRLTTGVACPDTQTGLRGIPQCLAPLACETRGNRYDYEMNFLMDAARTVPFVHVPIRTVYEDGNSSSHFRPLRDSLLIYQRPLRFLVSSLSGAVCDVALFAMILYLLTGSWDAGAARQAAGSTFAAQFAAGGAVILWATVFARIGSGLVNFFMNKYWSFQSRASGRREMIRYGILFLVQMISSAGLATLFSFFLPSVAGKMIADTGLFFISYAVQQRWVFSEKPARRKSRNRIAQVQSF
ncbi:MAG: bifunctional glycosyltransferase family 2/GtrA family protein [Eubacterium sp.]|nr:bifunctional glycosyltransferase family 2/GtrA family protein [Eubacterium sp.]